MPIIPLKMSTQAFLHAPFKVDSNRMPNLHFVVDGDGAVVAACVLFMHAELLAELLNRHVEELAKTMIVSPTP